MSNINELVEKRFCEFREEYSKLEALLNDRNLEVWKNWADPQKREDAIQQYNKIKDKMDSLKQELANYENSIPTAVLGFYCENTAIQQGFVSCSLLHDPKTRVKITHTFANQEEASRSENMIFTGIVDPQSVKRGLHCHLPGRMTCQICNYKHNFGRLPDVTQLPKPEEKRIVKKYQKKT